MKTNHSILVLCVFFITHVQSSKNNVITFCSDATSPQMPIGTITIIQQIKPIPDGYEIYTCLEHAKNLVVQFPKSNNQSVDILTTKVVPCGIRQKFNRALFQLALQKDLLVFADAIIAYNKKNKHSPILDVQYVLQYASAKDFHGVKSDDILVNTSLRSSLNYTTSQIISSLSCNKKNR